jgi:TPR repeat protein
VRGGGFSSIAKWSTAFRLGYIQKAPINRVKAEYYYTLAAKNGSEKAREKLAEWRK